MLSFLLADQCSLMKISMLDLVFPTSELTRCLPTGPCVVYLIFCYMLSTMRQVLYVYLNRETTFKCSPTLDHFQLVNVLAQVGSQTELEYSSLDSIRLREM